MSGVQPTIDVSVRWLLKRDFSVVLEIEEASFNAQLTARDLCRLLGSEEHIGIVAEHDSEVAGFAVYWLNGPTIELIRLAVEPLDRRLGVVNTLVNTLKSKLNRPLSSGLIRKEIAIVVRETNLAAQQFFLQAGFRAVKTLQNWFLDTGEDGYDMRFRQQV